MPTYVYECRPCNKVFGLVRPIDDRDLSAPCPSCSAPSTHRLFKGPFPLITRGVANPGQTTRPAVPGWAEPRPRGAYMVNCVADNCSTGIKISGPGTVHAYNTKLTRNRIALDVDEAATLNDENTIIE